MNNASIFPLTSQPGEPDPTALDRARAQDQAWFRAHPGRSRYVRDAIAGEFPVPMPPGTRVTVQQIAPGARVKWIGPLTPERKALIARLRRQIAKDGV